MTATQRGWVPDRPEVLIVGAGHDNACTFLSAQGVSEKKCEIPLPLNIQNYGRAVTLEVPCAQRGC